MRVRRFVGSLVFPLLAGFIMLSSCANQGEGERCDVNAGLMGTDDCQADLICTPSDQLRFPATSDGGVTQRPATPICCPDPLKGRPATAEVCKNMMSTIGSDAAIPDSASDAPAEASSEASSDAPSDSQSEASDAPSDVTGQ